MKMGVKRIFPWRDLLKVQIVIFLIIGILLYFQSKKNAEYITNIVLISADTLRADHLSCYGYDRQTSPNIDKFAKKSILFYNAISQATSTLPSHSSVFTSRYSSQHKTIKEGGIAIPLSESEVTLAEILKKKGYLTAAFTDGGEMAKIFNIGQGFDIYNDDAGGIKNINQRVFKWLEKNHDKKFFLFVHCYDIHWPYNPHPPTPFCNLYLSNFNFDNGAYRRIEKVIEGGARCDKTILKTAVALYDGGIAYTDKHIGELLDKIDELGLKDKTLIIFMSDHGEEFMEHLGVEHGETVYDEQIRVPLIFSNEKFFLQKQIKSQVRLIDITPTILEILDIPIPDRMVGKSLLGLMNGKNEAERIAFSENQIRNQLSCRSLRNKLILHASNSREEFYDLQHDPRETQILLMNNKHSTYRELLKEVARWRAIVEASAQPGIPLKISELEELEGEGGVIERLRALGYSD